MYEELVEEFKKRKINVLIVNSKEEAKSFVYSNISKDATVGTGGSLSVQQCGINLKDFNYIDRYANEDPEVMRDAFQKNHFSDVYITGSNAITKDGHIVNIDGMGNRVSALIFGPKKVFIIVGKNKIVDNYNDAIKRIETIAAPLNAKRLEKNTPCVKTGKCMHCLSSDSICRSTVSIYKQKDPNRMTIIIVNEDLGF